MASIDRRPSGRRHVRLALSAALLGLFLAGLLLVGVRPTPVEAATPAWTAYVTLEGATGNAVTPIDTGDNSVGMTIPMPDANMEPDGIAIDPTATTAYVSTDQDNALGAGRPGQRDGALGDRVAGFEWRGARRRRHARWERRLHRGRRGQRLCGRRQPALRDHVVHKSRLRRNAVGRRDHTRRHHRLRDRQRRGRGVAHRPGHQHPRPVDQRRRQSHGHRRRPARRQRLRRGRGERQGVRNLHRHERRHGDHRRRRRRRPRRCGGVAGRVADLCGRQGHRQRQRHRRRHRYGRRDRQRGLDARRPR